MGKIASHFSLRSDLSLRSVLFVLGKFRERRERKSLSGVFWRRHYVRYCLKQLRIELIGNVWTLILVVGRSVAVVRLSTPHVESRVRFIMFPTPQVE